MSHSSDQQKVQDLIRMLDQAVSIEDDAASCRNVKRVLVSAVNGNSPFIQGSYLTPLPDRYARRLLHRDPKGRYTVLVMVWDKGQGTPLHDHAGIWCVECVYSGRIRVMSYSIHGGDPENDIVQFRLEDIVTANVGDAGALIPPFEYHMLENADNAASVTIHVYGGEMDHCHVFSPAQGGWKREYRRLSYTEMR